MFIFNNKIFDRSNEQDLLRKTKGLETVTVGNVPIQTVNGWQSASLEGGGDMLKVIYDTNDNGVVDDSESLGGKPADEYVTIDTEQSITGEKTLESLVFDENADIPTLIKTGQLFWDNDSGTLVLIMKDTDVRLQIGQEQQLPWAKNGEATTIANGKLVYLFGASGSNPIVKLASNTASATSGCTIAMCTADVASNQHGYFTTFGLVRDINTNGISAGTKVYLGTNGDFTATIPTNNRKVDIGFVVREHATEGVVLVNIKKDYYETLYCPDDLNIQCAENKTLVITESVYRDEYVAGAYIAPLGATAPDSVAYTWGGNTWQKYSFDGSVTVETLSNAFEIPHDYTVGGTIEVHIHWRPATTGTGTVKWIFAWSYDAVNSLPQAETELSATYNITSDKQYMHLITKIDDLPVNGYTLGDIINFRIYRDPAQDTYTGDAIFEKVALHVPVDTLGSRQIYVK